MTTSKQTGEETAEQGRVMPDSLEVLFVCARNQWRSPTAERVYGRRPGIAARSAGLRSSARRRLKPDDLEWADVVFAMESRHAKQIRQEFPEHTEGLNIEVLDIPDEYRFMDEELVTILRELVDPKLEAHS